ncbi:hypothetical protein D7V88_12890 [Corallococcus terminator]|uniref:Uncharacterized protein n=1 Tax=Corallococcus terminator TaxID=2316733 RepID=A0A3A8J390_9BACT|nr:hypothetical protein D7V88_12890 [Corallococcus terminator]
MDQKEDHFEGTGVIDPNPRHVFELRGTGKEQLRRFLRQVKSEGAQVTHGPPPFEVKTGGDKPPTSDGPPPGLKSDGQTIKR